MSWFPALNVTLYGYTNPGAWKITFKKVSCESWAGFNVTNVSAPYRSEKPSVTRLEADIPSTSDSPPSPTLLSAATRVAALSILGYVRFAHPSILY